MTTTIIRDPDETPQNEMCDCWMLPKGHPNGDTANLAHAATDHNMLVGKRVISRTCSICGQEWGDGAISRHEYCAISYADGSRRYADCVTNMSDGSILQYMR